jgi:hypothetical protein
MSDTFDEVVRGLIAGSEVVKEERRLDKPKPTSFKKVLLFVGGTIVVGAIAWALFPKHMRRLDELGREAKLKPNRKYSERGAVVAGAKLIRSRLGLSMGEAVKLARKVRSSMPGHPSGKAIFAEARLLQRGGKSSKFGSGSRFAAKVRALKRRGFNEQRARAIAAAQSRKAYGARYFAELSQLGRQKKKRSKR